MIIYKTHDTSTGLKVRYKLIRYLSKQEAIDVSKLPGEQGYYEGNILTFPLRDMVYGFIGQSDQIYKHIVTSMDFSKIEESDKPILKEFIKYIFKEL
jgi:hypothetical protein